MAKEKKKKSIFKRWWFWVIAVIVVFAMFSGGDDEDDSKADSSENNDNVENVSAENEGNNNENENQDNDAQDEEENENNSNGNNDEEVEFVKIGEPAEIADVTFTVNSVEETDVISSDNEFIDDATTDGKFLIIDITVDNDKNEAITIDSSYFKIVTEDEKEYKTTTDADVIMALGDKMGDFFLKDINPGLSKDGQLVFEVSGDLEASKTTLHAQTGFWGTETIEVLLTK